LDVTIADAAVADDVAVVDVVVAAVAAVVATVGVAAVAAVVATVGVAAVAAVVATVGVVVVVVAIAEKKLYVSTSFLNTTISRCPWHKYKRRTKKNMMDIEGQTVRRIRRLRQLQQLQQLRWQRRRREGGGWFGKDEALSPTIKLDNRVGNKVRVRFYCTYEDPSEANPLWRVRSQAIDWNTDRTADPKKLILETNQSHTMKRPSCTQPGAELGAFVAPYVPSNNGFQPQPWLVTAQTASTIIPSFGLNLPPQPKLPNYHPLKRWSYLNSEYRYFPIDTRQQYPIT
jgi:hypothetical protein